MEKEKLAAKPQKKRLKTLADVRRYLSSLINETRSGEVDGVLAGRLGFLLNILRSVISDGDLELRILALENEAAKKEANR